MPRVIFASSALPKLCESFHSSHTYNPATGASQVPTQGAKLQYESVPLLGKAHSGYSTFSDWKCCFCGCILKSKYMQFPDANNGEPFDEPAMAVGRYRFQDITKDDKVPAFS